MTFLKKWRLAICFISLTIILMAVIIIPSSITSRNAIRVLAREIMVNISSYTLDKSENYLRPAEKAAELTRFLADSKIVSSNRPESMIKYFYQQMSQYDQFTSIYYGNTKGEFFMASRSNAKIKNGYYTKRIQLIDGKRIVNLSWSSPDHKLLDNKTDFEDRYDPRKRPWFIDAVLRDEVIWTEPYLFFTGKKPGITTASPVYDSNGVLQGVVGVDISIEELSIFLSKLTIGEKGKAFIVNSNGDVVAFPDLDELKQVASNGHKIRLSKISELKDSVSRQAFKSLNLPPDQLPKNSVFTTFIHNGSSYSAMFTPFKDSQWPWIIGIYFPDDDYLGGIKFTRKFNVLIALIVVLLAGAVGWAVARKIETARMDAIAANKAKSRFLAVMSHEIRTPMNVILGATGLLKESNPSEDQKSFVALLENAGEGLLDLINDILDMSKVEAGLLELESISFNPDTVLRQSCSVFSINASAKGIDLEFEVSPDFPSRAIGDPVRIKQVLLNLIGNAVKFTSKGGVYVKAQAVESARTETLKLVFTVHDTGPGIPKKQHQAIFENFTQADKSVTRKHQGTGLGLAISKSLSQMMGGDISVKSTPGKGSTFTFTATLSKDKSTPMVKQKNENESVINTNPQKILLVEDNKSNQMLFTHYLKDSPHTVEMADNGEEGIEKFIALQPDIIFMDIEMPIMDGYEAVQKIREWEKRNDHQPTPIIALSAHAIKGTEQRARYAGCTAYMTKPVTKIQILDNIKREVHENNT